MKLYMGFDREEGSQEGAVLIFASSAKEARLIGWPFIENWFGTEWIFMSVRMIKENTEHLKMSANQEKLKAGFSHVISCPDVCPNCKVWGGGEPMDGTCDYCED